MITFIKIGINESGIDSGEIDYEFKEDAFFKWWRKQDEKEQEAFYDMIDRIKDHVTDNAVEMSSKANAALNEALKPDKEVKG